MHFTVSDLYPVLWGLGVATFLAYVDWVLGIAVGHKFSGFDWHLLPRQLFTVFGTQIQPLVYLGVLQVVGNSVFGSAIGVVGDAGFALALAAFVGGMQADIRMKISGLTSNQMVAPVPITAPLNASTTATPPVSIPDLPEHTGPPTLPQA